MLVDYIRRQKVWSGQTFGGGKRTKGIIRHIESELDEILFEPSKLEEWIDVIILGLDGAWRAGYQPEQIVKCLIAKQKKNMARKWPPPLPEDQPTFHVKEENDL